MVSTHSIGIMTTNAPGYDPFPEANYYAALSQIAAKDHLNVYVFFPESISFPQRVITGYKWNQGQWIFTTFPFPDLIYDRVFYNASYFKKTKDIVHAFKQQVPFMNRGLPSKWGLYLQLNSDPRIRAYLPMQVLYTNTKQLKRLLLREKSIIIKPISGGFGRRVFHLIDGTPAILEGRNQHNQYFRKNFDNSSQAIAFLAPHLNHRYLLQRFLQLQTTDKSPFDVRIFAQKNARGEWCVIGKGIRMGPKNKLTSNIHGGGNGLNYTSFIQSTYPNKYKQINTTVEKIGILVPEILERSYYPLFELGIDVGIDREGNVWIIEANAKPGRQIFELMGDQSASLQAISGPIHYAQYVLEREQGGSK